MGDENREFCQSVENATLKIITEQVNLMNKACLVVERDAKMNCSVDIGLLKASISHKVDADTKDIIGSIFSNLDYAPFLEKGTGVYAKDGNGRRTPWKYNVKAGKYKGWHTTNGQQPQPFLEPARDNNKDRILEILGGKK